MTDRTQFEQMLEALINEDKSTAQEIFHNIVVAKSREIYEELLENDFGKQDTDTPDADKGITDDADKDDSEDDFSDKDSTDDMMSDVDSDDDSDSDSDEDHSDEDVEDRVQDLEDALEDLKAEFEQLMAGEEGEGHDMGGEEGEGHDMGGDEFGAEEPAGDDFGAEPGVEDEGMDNGQTLNVKHTFAEDDEKLIREYIEKVGTNWESYNGAEGGHVGSQAGSVTGSTNTKSIVASKNDMGGTTANIAQGHQEVKGDQGARSTVTGNGVMSANVVPNPDASGNINVPGGKAGKTAYKTQVKGGGIDRQAGFTKPGMQVGATDSSGRGESNTKSPLNARK